MSAKGMCDIGYKQGAEFFTALEKAGFTCDIVQQVINDRGNKKAEAMYAAVTGSAGAVVSSPKPILDKFELLMTFEVVVPGDYNHATRLDSFKIAHEPEFRKYNCNITGKNFCKVTDEPVVGQKLLLKVFGIKKGRSASSEECLAKYRSENAYLFGVHGVCLAYEQGKDKLRRGKGYVSFDEEDALWWVGGYARVTYLFVDFDGDYDFHVDNFEGDWSDGNCLLCFCDLPETSDT